MNVKVTVRAPVNPTEIKERVETAITNIFPTRLELQDFGIPSLYGSGGLENLRTFHRLLREERILDTARHIMLSRSEGGTLHFHLSKQIAFIGKVNFPPVEESLGSIHVEISANNQDDLQTIIDWLAPETFEGYPVKEIEL
jgi:predicted RNA binding protein with dsRBD fold (UPF0201 family)